MTSINGRFAVRTLVVAVHGALAALALAPAPAAAEDTDLAALTRPASVVEVGALYVDKDSAKFGEFNGLDQKGVYGIGNFGLFGGAGDDNPYRWKLTGSNLGLDTRNVQGEAGAQGRWRVSGGYDEIVRNQYDTYQTLWNGGGSTSLTLPSNFPPIAQRRNAGALSNWANIQTPNATGTTTGGGPGNLIPADMQGFDVGTKRKIGNVAVSAAFAPGWEFTASVRREQKEGTRLMGMNMGRFTGPSSLLPEPIDATTDQFMAAVAYADKKLNFNIGYYGSFYRNDINGWTVDYPGNNGVVLGNVARFSASPDNDMHQINVGGGYRFSSTTRLQMSGSVSRMTQNQSYIEPLAASGWQYSDTSPHAKVNNTFFYGRFSTELMPKLGMNAAYRYDYRDNKTPLQEFHVTTSDTVGAASTIFDNEPMNRKAHTATADLEYRLGPGRAIRGEYEWQQVERTSDAEESPFRAEKTHENTGRIAYRQAFSDTVTGRFSYAYSQRRNDGYEEGLGGLPPPPNEGLMAGFEQFYLADRNRDKLRSQVSFQPTDKVALQATLDYNRDSYDPKWGLKESKGWMFGLDGSLAVSEKIALNAYYSYEDMRHKLDAFAIPRGTSASPTVPHTPDGSCAPYSNASGTVPADALTDPCRNWSQDQADKIHTIGVGAVVKGLAGGRLDLSADLSYSNARTPISMSGGTYYSNGVANSATGNVYIPAESFPDVKTELTQLRLSGLYNIDKNSAVRVTYIYGKLKSSDWAYDAYANSMLGVIAIPIYVGPGMTSPNYDVNVIGVSYVYRFR